MTSSSEDDGKHDYQSDDLDYGVGGSGTQSAFKFSNDEDYKSGGTNQKSKDTFEKKRGRKKKSLSNHSSTFGGGKGGKQGKLGFSKALLTDFVIDIDHK